MCNVPIHSTLSGTILMNVESEVHITETTEGFLTIGKETGGCITWNRRWCVLQQHELKYWNYPCDTDTSEPLEVIDLTLCATSVIGSADRKMCARPRTLFIETIKNIDQSPTSDNRIQRFLSADSNNDKKNWENKLNSVISFLRNWNRMKVSFNFRS